MTDQELKDLQNKATAFDTITGNKAKEKLVAHLKSAINLILTIEKRLIEKINRTLDSTLEKVDRRLEQVKDGKDGRNGKDGLDGLDGKDGRDGKDADEASLLSTLKAGLPTKEDIANEVVSNGEKTRDSLELLQGEERLDKKAIKGLEEEFAKLSEKMNLIRRGSIGGGGRALRLLDFQFTGDGVTTSFTLPHEPSGKGKAIWIYYNSAWLQPTTHYTLAGKTLTLTFTPEAPLSGLTYNIEGTMIV